MTHLITPDEITYPDGKVPEGAASKAYKALIQFKRIPLAYQNKDKDPNSKKRYGNCKACSIAWSLLKISLLIKSMVQEFNRNILQAVKEFVEKMLIM